MAGTAGAKRLTEADKAQLIATLASNGGNVKRTASQLGLQPATVRRYRDRFERGDGPAETEIVAAVTDFVEDATRIRNKALIRIEQRIDSGDIKTSELITATGVLFDKINMAQGLPTARTELTSALPDPDALRAALAPILQGAIEAAERRHDEIVDAEIVEVLELPQTT